jgi:hypothetical protein
MSYNGKYHKGYARVLRQLKREEADARNAQTPENRRRKTRPRNYKELLAMLP